MICSASVAMVSDSVRNTRSFDFSGLPRNVPEASGKGCLLGPFWGLFGRPPGLVWAQISVLRRVPGYTPGPKVSKMGALRPLLPILAISAKFHAYARETSNLLPNSGREKWCEILRENLERPVRIFQKCVSLGRRALF